jgi:hypothetical protein
VDAHDVAVCVVIRIFVGDDVSVADVRGDSERLSVCVLDLFRLHDPQPNSVGVHHCVCNGDAVDVAHHELFNGAHRKCDPLAIRFQQREPDGLHVGDVIVVIEPQRVWSDAFPHVIDWHGVTVIYHHLVGIPLLDDDGFLITNAIASSVAINQRLSIGQRDGNNHAPANTDANPVAIDDADGELLVNTQHIHEFLCERHTVIVSECHGVQNAVAHRDPLSLRVSDRHAKLHADRVQLPDGARADAAHGDERAHRPVRPYSAAVCAVH